MTEITYNEAEKLLKKHIKDEINIFNHSRTVSNFLYKTCLKIKKLHPELNINPEKMRIIGLLHDIGRDKLRKDIFHANAGAKILEKEGLKNYANIIKTHAIAKEVAEIKDIKEDFEPKTLEQELLTYADAHVKHGEVVSFEKRFNDVLERNKNNPERYEALKKGFKRIEKIIRKIDKLLA